MVKYLIEDIIPPEKKHRRGGMKKEQHSGRSVPLEREEKQRVPKKSIKDQFPESPHESAVVEVEEAAPVSAAEEPSITPHASEAGSVAPEMNIWGRDLHPVDTQQIGKEHIPPQFPEYSETSSSYDGGGGVRAWVPWLIGVALLLVAGFFTLDFFGGATVTILPKHELVPLDQKFAAFKSTASDKLSYAIMIETASSTLEVPATGEKTVTAKASGRIVVYNEQATAQRLIKNTRFQAPGGKIYRISDSITIPKATVQGGAKRPGSLEVTVYADEAGPAYNSPPVDFTVPGLKNSTIYEKVYARSKGPITGGASGTVKTVSDQDLREAGENLRIQLETKLRAKSRGNLATSQLAYDQGIVVALGEPKLSNVAASAENKAVVSAEGTIYVVTFQRADLARAIIGALAPESAGENVEIKNLDTLVFAMDPQKGDALLAGSKLDFTLKGTPELIWTIEEDAVKSALVGLPKARFNEVLSQHKSVERAKAAIRPMWKRSFPDNVEKISIVLVDSIPEEN